MIHQKDFYKNKTEKQRFVNGATEEYKTAEPREEFALIDCRAFVNVESAAYCTNCYTPYIRIKYIEHPELKDRKTLNRGHGWTISISSKYATDEDGERDTHYPIVFKEYLAYLIYKAEYNERRLCWMLPSLSAKDYLISVSDIPTPEAIKQTEQEAVEQWLQSKHKINLASSMIDAIDKAIAGFNNGNFPYYEDVAILFPTKEDYYSFWKTCDKEAKGFGSCGKIARKFKCNNMRKLSDLLNKLNEERKFKYKGTYNTFKKI